MNILMIIYCFIGLQIGLIFILFLKEIGATNKMLNTLDWIYMEIATHPKANKWVHIFGDSMYMIGGSVEGAGLYEYVNNDNILTGVLLFGIIMIIIGAYIKEKAKKKGF